MTKQKHGVRDRMLKTGASYVSARRNVLRQSAPSPAGSIESPHFAGNVPAATALRALLAHRGVRAPHTGHPFSEAMVFGIAGGIGAGVFAFRYEKEDFSSFFVAGRHLWEADLIYLQRAAGRFGAETQTQEATGAKKGLLQLKELLQAAGPVIAWVDLADAPITISLGELAVARARIGKQKHRLLGLTGEPNPIDLAVAIQDGLRACHAGLTKGRSSNFTLEGFRNWGEQLVAPGKEGWPVKFPAGRNLWRGLTSILDFTEHYGTGGGLTRPLFSDFLQEASQALERPDLAELAERYAELGAAGRATRRSGSGSTSSRTRPRCPFRCRSRKSRVCCRGSPSGLASSTGLRPRPLRHWIRPPGGLFPPRHGATRLEPRCCSTLVLSVQSQRRK